MYEKDEVLKLIDEAQKSMENTKKMFGKEVYQKRFKPMFEGYITALCTVIELDDEDRTEMIKGKSITTP